MVLNKCQNMLLGIAIGDAFGAAYETKAIGSFSLDTAKYSAREGIKEGGYTDDTQMSIAVAEVLLRHGKNRSMQDFAESFLRCCKRDKRQGYGAGFESMLNACSSGAELMIKLNGSSERNGAAMRSVPFGIMQTIDDAVSAAAVSAIVTHNSKKGIASAFCIASASHYFYHNIGAPEGVFDYCIKACNGYDKETEDYLNAVKAMATFDPLLLFGIDNKDYGVPCDGMRTTGAVLHIVSKYGTDLKMALEHSVMLGGDTDTTAAIACGIVAMSTGLDNLPGFLLQNLEDGQYGKSYLLKLGEKLCQKYPSQ